MENYNHQKIEKKWQEYWEEKKLFKTNDNSKKKKFYCLDMFPYPSGAGLHVGHPEGYTATDIYSRYLRMNGYEVLHPMGWDAFGLPAENYAIKTNLHPKKTTAKNIKTFKRQIKSLGFSYDWDREFSTSDPRYYKWSQWFFLLMYKNDLAYQKKAPVNWCKSCKTVLANEQVVDGKCERCKNEVIQKELKQWFFRVTKYADRLIKDLDQLDWPESLKYLQRNWIGKSEGSLIKFPISDFRFPIEVFTTRADTLYGATYLVLAPEHKIISNIKFMICNWKEVKNYIQKTKCKTELERKSLDKTKTGVELKGVKAVNPATKKEIPIWIADYVLTTYGTSAIMAVPAHDQRDFEFAKKYRLPIIEVISPDGKTHDFKKAYIGDGILINSDRFNGINWQKAKLEITKYITGKETINYKIRDWLISRQRYWGAPIPIIYCDQCGTMPVPEKDLPVVLPDDVDFRPKGKSPLSYSSEFTNVKCPKCSGNAQRETDTMDGFVDNSWYYFRYCDPKNSQEFANTEKIKKWMPVDLYVGGAEHAVGHLIYSRFFTKVLHDLGYIKFDEPFIKLVNQGLILAEDGRKMSKSLGNVINPDEVVKKYGADTIRMYEMFMGPLDDTKLWSTKGIIGIRRFIEKVWRYYHRKIKIDQSSRSIQTDRDISVLLTETVNKVTSDIKSLKLNTAISQMMIFINKVQKVDVISIQKKESDFFISKVSLESFLKILSPFAPHLAEELWHQIGNKKSIFLEQWPEIKKLIDRIIMKIPVMLNAKKRTLLEIDTTKDLSKEQIIDLALKNPNVSKWLNDKKPKKIIYISGKILSIVI